MEDNKQIALNVLKGAFIDRDPSVVGRYFAPGYTQHNPSLPDGPGPIPAMIAGFPDNFQYVPGCPSSLLRRIPLGREREIRSYTNS